MCKEPVYLHANRDGLSFQEELLYQAIENTPGNPGWNLVRLFEIHGPIHVQRLEKCLHLLFRQHEVFRTGFVREKNRLLRVVHPETRWSLRMEELGATGDAATQIKTILHNWRHISFDPSKPTPVFAGLLKVKDHHHYLFLSVSHLIFDGWSTTLCLQQLFKFYSQMSFGLSPQLSPPDFMLSDYVRWQRNEHFVNASKETQDFWNHIYSSWKPTLIPYDKPFPEKPAFLAALHRITVGFAELQPLVAFQQQTRFSFAYILVSVFQIVLFLLTRESTIGLMFIYSNRYKRKFQSLVGLLASGLPYHIQIDEKLPFLDLLTQHHEHYTTLLHKASSYCHNPSGFPRIQFNYYDGNIDALYSAPLQFGPVQFRLEKTLLPHYMFSTCSLYMIIRKLDTHFECMAMYQAEWYEHSTIEAMCNACIQALNLFCQNPSLSIEALAQHIDFLPGKNQ